MCVHVHAHTCVHACLLCKCVCVRAHVCVSLQRLEEAAHPLCSPGPHVAGRMAACRSGLPCP